MTERWQRELKRLDLLDPPSSLPSRIGQPSRSEVRERRPPRVPVIVVSFALFVGAASFAWWIFGLNRSEPATTEGSALPNVARIACTEDGTVVSTPRIQVRRDGPHFSVDNQSEMDVVIVNSSDNTAEIDPSRPEAVLDLTPPGEILVGCFTHDELVGVNLRTLSVRDGMVPIDIVDPAGLYVSPHLDCPEEEMVEEGPYFPDPANDFDSPEHLIRSVVPGVRANDIVEPVSYPETQDRDWRVVRQGRVVGLVYLPRHPEGVADHVGIVTACQDSGIGRN
jgi:hypothetical protein